MAKVIVCDLDGVVWTGTRPIPGAAAAIGALRAAGWHVAFFTNNSSRRIGEVQAQLAQMEIATESEDVLSSAQAAAGLLRQDLAAGSRVLVSGGPGIAEALTARELVAVANDRALEAPVAAVVCGMDRAFDFDRLDRAAQAVRDGARFVATNTDATFPGTDHIAPGAGALVAAVATASGHAPEIAGKPEAAAAALVRERVGETGVMIGDRPSTDGEFARRLGWPFAMVLSGIGGHDPTEPVPDPPPAWVAADLGALVGPLVGYRGA